jgi:hypothetical protein
MKCSKIQSRLVTYYYGEDTPELRAETETHLHECPLCRKEWVELRDLLDTVPRDWKVGISDIRRQEMRAAIEERLIHASRKRVRPLQVRWKPLLTSAMIVLFIGFLGYKLFPSPETWTPDIGPEEELEIAENLDLIRNMELLELFDALQEIVDNPEPNHKEEI